MSSSHIKNVAIVGATGHVGFHFTESLLKTGKHTVTALVRDGSQGTLPADAKSVSVDYESEDSIVSALQGQEFLIIALSSRAPQDLIPRITQAAAKAGVKWVLPNVYGSDIRNEKLAQEDLYGSGSLQRCTAVQEAGMSYLAMSCGFWYEWSLAWGELAFGIDIPNRRATLFDEGKQRITVSTWEQCGRAIAAFLSLPESGTTPSLDQWRNNVLYFSSFSVSQRDMLDSLHRVLGTTDSDWDITHQPAKERWESAMAKLKAGDRMGFVVAMYTRTFFSSGDGDYEYRGLANDTLGLPKEDLDEATRNAVARATKTN